MSDFGWPALMSKSLAAKYLDVSTKTLERIRGAGDIKTVMIKSLPKYRRLDLDQLIEELPEGEGQNTFEGSK